MCLGARSIRVTLEMWGCGAFSCDSFTTHLSVHLLNVSFQKPNSPERPHGMLTHVQTLGYLFAKFT